MNFVNEPELDLTQEAVQKHLQQAFAQLDATDTPDIPLVIGGKRIYTDETLASVNPAQKSEVVGNLSLAQPAQIDDALAAGRRAFQEWKFISVADRNQLATKLVNLVREHRYELIAIIVEESGKNVGEADGEICELIDFIHAYMIGMEQLKDGLDYLVPSPVESREARYLPLGVGAAIAPWNFPLAILGGMVMGAVLAGNAMIMKPSSDTAVVGYRLFELMEQAGFPTGLINFITGKNAEMGDYLVKHPKLRFINFTGSKQVGLHINQLAATPQPGQIWIKRVVAEMGGKNAIIVDDDADLDQAAAGIISSAFTMQGQKCSANSRLIVLDSVYDQLLAKVETRMKALNHDPARANGDVGPVIAKRAFDKITSYIDYGKDNPEQNTLLVGGNYDDTQGWFIEPTLFEVTATSRIFNEEIFGPVLGVIKVSSFEEALQLANDTAYGLTGSLYSKNQAHIKTVVDDWYVGNLYINRKTTGAVVYQHPFGGFNLSGTDGKTGTTNYVQQFLELQSVTNHHG